MNANSVINFDIHNINEFNIESLEKALELYNISCGYVYYAEFKNNMCIFHGNNPIAIAISFNKEINKLAIRLRFEYDNAFKMLDISNYKICINYKGQINYEQKIIVDKIDSLMLCETKCHKNVD